MPTLPTNELLSSCKINGHWANYAEDHHGLGPLLQLLGLKPRRSMSMTTAKVHSIQYTVRSSKVELLIAG